MTAKNSFLRGDLCVKNGIVQSSNPYGNPAIIPPCGINVMDVE